MSVPIKTIEPLTITPQAERIVLGGNYRGTLSDLTGEQYLQVQVHLLDGNNKFLAERWVGLTLEEANLWGEDDAVLYDIIAPKLGITVTGTYVEPEPEPEPEPEA